MPNTDDVNERYDQAQIQAEQRLEQIRQEMGADNKVFERDLFRSLPSVSSPFGTSQPELSARGGAPGVEQALRDMTRHSFYAALPEIQQNLGVKIDKQQVDAIVASLSPRQDGFVRTLDDELDQHPLDLRDELARLHKIGWHAFQDAGLPLSAVIELERHGGHYSGKVFDALVRLGAHVRDQQHERR